MAYAIFDFRAEFCKGLRFALGNKDRVVPEPSRTLRTVNDSPLAGSVKNGEQVAALCHGHRATKTRRTQFDACHPAQKQFEVACVGGALPGETCRADAGRPSQAIHFQPGIVGEHHHLFISTRGCGVTGNGDGFQHGVFLERQPRFLHFGEIRMRREVFNPEASRKHGGDLSGLVPVTRGDQKRCHWPCVIETMAEGKEPVLNRPRQPETQPRKSN